MKTLNEVRQEKEQIISDSKLLDLKTKKGKSAYKKNGSRVEFINLMINYLEHGIDETYLKKEKQRLSSIVNGCEIRIKELDLYFPKDKAKLRKDSGATLAKQQLNALNYIS